MVGERRTFSENMLIEEVSKVRRLDQPLYFDPKELERLATSKTIINYLIKNGYKIDLA